MNAPYFHSRQRHHLLDLTAMAADIHAANIKAGWWKPHPKRFLRRLPAGVQDRNIGELLCLVHSEIDEAVTGYRNSLQDDKLPHRLMVEVEMADTAIRLLDILGWQQVDIDSLVRYASSPSWSLPAASVDSICCDIHGAVTAAMEGYRKGRYDDGNLRLVDGLRLIIDFCDRAGLDLFGAIAEKRAFNAVREDHRIENRAKAGGKRW